jgi:putative ABC transport system substrate-binding protein
MRKTIVGFVLSAMLFALCLPAEAQQQEKVPRIGFLSTAALSSLSSRLEAFRQGLRELGYVEGKNITIDYRSAEGNVDGLPEFAAELVLCPINNFTQRR